MLFAVDIIQETRVNPSLHKLLLVKNITKNTGMDIIDAVISRTMLHVKYELFLDEPLKISVVLAR